MFLRRCVPFFLAVLTGLTSISAYFPKHLGEDGVPAQESFLHAQTAILVDESGEPRCWMGKHPNELYQTETADFDTLKECDESDELYARLIHETEEISYGSVPLPTSLVGKISLSWVANLFLGVVGGCISDKTENLGKKLSLWGRVGSWSLTAIGSVLATGALTQSVAYVVIVGLVGYGPGAVLGAAACPI